MLLTLAVFFCEVGICLLCHGPVPPPEAVRAQRTIIAEVECKMENCGGFHIRRIYVWPFCVFFQLGLICCH